MGRCHAPKMLLPRRGPNNHKAAIFRAGIVHLSHCDASKIGCVVSGSEDISRQVKVGSYYCI